VKGGEIGVIEQEASSGVRGEGLSQKKKIQKQTSVRNICEVRKTGKRLYQQRRIRIETRRNFKR